MKIYTRINFNYIIESWNLNMQETEICMLHARESIWKSDHTKLYFPFSMNAENKPSLHRASLMFSNQKNSGMIWLIHLYYKFRQSNILLKKQKSE